MQNWPVLKTKPLMTAPTAFSTSASSKTMCAALPPSSIVTGLRASPAALATCRPTAVEPVKAILSTPWCRSSASPATGPRAGDDVDDAVRDTRLLEQPGHVEGAERGLVGRLVHDGVAGGQRRAQLRTGEDQREVERGDRGDDTDGLALGVGEGVVDRLAGRTVEGEGEGGEVLVVVGRVRHVDGAAQADRLAHVEALQLRDLVRVLPDQLGHPVQDPAALASGRRGPRTAVEGLARGTYGRVHVGRRRLRDGRDDRAPGRVDHLRTRSVGRLAPLPSDEQSPGFDLEGGHHHSSASSPRFQSTGFLLVRSLITDRFPVNALI